MADSLRELISESIDALRDKADDQDRTTTTREDLIELADGIAKDKAESVCTFTAGALTFVQQSGDEGLGLMVEAPDDVYGGEGPLDLLRRNIEEALFDELSDEVDSILGDWEFDAEEAAEDGDDYDNVPDFDQNADGTFHAI